MAGDNLVLYVATYNDPAAAASDYKTLKDAEGSDELVIEGSVVVSRDADGKVAVKETGGAEPVHGHACRMFKGNSLSGWWGLRSATCGATRTGGNGPGDTVPCSRVSCGCMAK